MLKNKRGDAAILFSLGVSLLIFGYIAILQVIQSNAIKINIKNMLALDGFLTSEVYAWQGFLTKKRQDAGYSVSIDSTQTKYYTSGATFCGTTSGGAVCLAAKEESGSTGGSWEQVSTSGAPTMTGNGSPGYSFVWTGKKLIVWDGMNNLGGIFDPAVNTWSIIRQSPIAHIGHGGAVWAGDQMVVYGMSYTSNDPTKNGTGCYAISYNPDRNEWKSLKNPPAGSQYSDQLCRWGSGMAASVGSQVMITEGYPYVSGWVTSLWVYDVSSNSWTVSSAPGETAMFQPAIASNKVTYSGCVYQFSTSSFVKKGFVYDPASSSWSDMNLTNAPKCGSNGTVVLSTGTKVFHWAGTEGGIYDPVKNSWEVMSVSKAPAIRNGMVRVWTGDKMIVWGGWGSDCINTNTCGTGGIYDPAKKTWTATAIEHAPKASSEMASAWVTNRALVWGGAYLDYNAPNSMAWSKDTYYYYPNGK